jgi:hypothetical protein
MDSVGIVFYRALILVAVLFVSCCGEPKQPKIVCKCVGQSKCPDFPLKATKRIKELIRERDGLREKVEQVREGNEYHLMHMKTDIEMYGKNFYDLTPEEIKKHDIYKAHIKNAIRVLTAILDGEDLSQEGRSR